jgi:hypothetical protein
MNYEQAPPFKFYSYLLLSNGTFPTYKQRDITHLNINFSRDKILVKLKDPSEIHL